MASYYQSVQIAYNKMQHGVSWRWHHYCQKIMGIVRPSIAQVCLAWRWHMTGRGRPHHLPGILVVSLTSYPKRFDTLHLTLRSLLRQKVRADHTILWIAHEDFSDLPQEVLVLQARGLEIRTTENIKSYKKIIPAVDNFPNAFICTADDDIYYRASWLHELTKNVSGTNLIVPCHRAHEITADSHGNFKPYTQWIFDTPFRGESKRLFPTSGSGIIYPPGSLAYTPQDRSDFLELCPDSDDLWLFWIARKNGISFKTIGKKRHLINWRGTQVEALWHKNVMQGGNDRQIQKMASRYGYPSLDES